MKLLHVKQARAVWLFEIQDLNPKGKDFIEELVDWIKESYSFIVAPDAKDVLSKAGKPDSPGLIFKRGHFQVREDLFIEISSLAIHSDGVVVDTVSSTEDSELFLKDILESASKEFGLAYDPAIIRKRLYISTVIAEMDLPIEKVHPGLGSFADKISDALGNGSSRFHPAGFAFWTDPNENGQHKTFTVAPQLGRSLTERRFFSESPLKTGDHLRLLTELEQVVSKSP
jgi:hypothetical protein